MTLPKYLSYSEDCFSFSLKFVLTQFKFIPAEFKYRRDSNGLNIPFVHRQRQTQEYILNGKSFGW